MTPGTNYNFRARYGSEAGIASYSPIYTLATEEPLQLANADMNDWSQEHSRKLREKMLSFTTSTFTSHKPNSGVWATTNEKTFNQGTGYVINAYPSITYQSRSNHGNASVIRSI